MKRKSLMFLFLLISSFFVLTACGGPENTYKKAQSLLSESKYTEAAELFESIGSYENAAKLAMYCKACALCEEGNFETGIAGFEALGDYNDSKMRIAYYSARSWDDSSVTTTEYEQMEHAIELYSKNPLYLDSTTRIASLEERIENAKLILYNNAVEVGENGKYELAKSTFERLGNYKDSSKLYTYYDIRADEAIAMANTDQDSAFSVSTRYLAMENFNDSEKRAAELLIRANNIIADKYAEVASLIEKSNYAAAEILLDSFGQYGNENVKDNYYCIGEKYIVHEQWDAASIVFGKIYDYKDASKRITYCVIRQAEDDLGDSNNIEALNAIATRYMAMGEYLDCTERATTLNNRITTILDNKYDVAVTLMNECNPAEAYSIFVALDGYKDSNFLAEQTYPSYMLQQLTKAKVDTYVTLGVYEQDQNTDNGKEALEWRVLEKKDNKLLVISRYGLNTMAYNNKKQEVTWETCTLRKWLNNEFYNTVFNSIEKSFIQKTSVPNDTPSLSGNNASGEVTEDFLFLLSATEVEQYLNYGSRRCQKPIRNSDYYDWWLRSPGRKNNSEVTVVTSEGKFDYSFRHMDWEDWCLVRPALWITLEP